MNLDGLLPTETFSAILGLARAASPVSTWTPPNSGGEVRVPIWDHRHQVKLTGADAPTEDELPRFLANNPACSVYSSLSPSECHHSDGGWHEDDELPCLDNRVLERPTARKRGLSPTPAGVGEDSSRRRPNGDAAAGTSAASSTDLWPRVDHLVWQRGDAPVADSEAAGHGVARVVWLRGSSSGSDVEPSLLSSPSPTPTTSSSASASASRGSSSPVPSSSASAVAGLGGLLDHSDVLWYLASHVEEDDRFALALTSVQLHQAVRAALRGGADAPQDEAAPAAAAPPLKTRLRAAVASVPRLRWALTAAGLDPADARVCAAAAARGDVGLVSEARRLGCVWDESTCKAAARHGHAEVLAWCRARGCPWQPTAACRAAARHGELGVLRWARENGWEWDETACYEAALGGQLEVLQWLRQHGCPWDGFDVCSSAALEGHLEVLVWAREHGAEWDEETCASAALEGELYILQWAHEHGCPWSARTAAAAAGGGNLPTLAWLHEAGCEMDEQVCAEAAGGGHLELLKWAREHGCAWSQATPAAAAEGGYVEPLEWALDRGCPWDPTQCLLAAYRAGHAHVLKWISDRCERG